MRPRVVSLACVVLLGCSQASMSQSALNLDFESRTLDPSAPDGWFVGGQGYEIRLDEANARSGKVALRMTRKAKGGFGVATANLPVNLARGKTVRLGGEIWAENVKDGEAALWLRVDGPGGEVLGFDNMTARIVKGETVPDDRGVRGTVAWKRYEIEVKVNPPASNINFGCLLAGDGTAWFDGLSLEFDGKTLEQANAELKASLVLKPVQLEWLKAGAIPFVTAEAGRGLDDLRALKATIGDAHIVSLGEATHGTAEFFKMKHRLTEFLATEMGFTIFAIEASMPEAFRMNEFVLHGKGDPKELLQGMYFWTWNTQEVLDMILWMRKFNRSGKGRVEFLGFDMQEPKVAAENVRDFVAKADPDFAETLKEAYAGLKSYGLLQRDLAPAWARPAGEGNPEEKAERAKADAAKLLGRAGEVLEHLEKGRDRLIRADEIDAPAVDWAIQNARIVVQAITVLTDHGEYRDRCMADNVNWVLGHRPTGTKVVLWAHNGHVAKRKGSMGGFLSERHGADMVVAGFAFHEGRYTAVDRGKGLKANDAGPSEPGSVEWAFHQSGLPRAILDLRKAEKSSLASGWLVEPIDHRNIGALAMGSAFAPNDLRSSYDLLIFFDQTTASQLLPPHRRQ